MGVQVSPQRNGLFPDVLLCNGFSNIIHSFLPLKTCQHGDFDQHHLYGKQDQEKLLTVCNFSDKNAEVEVPEEFKGAECLITNLGRKEFERKIVLNPYEAFVLYYKH